MTPLFVDSNVFLSYMTQSNRDQAAQANGLFEKARGGKVSLVTGPPVFFEIAWTLRKVFQFSNESVLNTLQSIMSLPGLAIADHATVDRALTLAAASKIGFADCYIAALAEASGAAVATFNRADFEQLPVALHPWR